MPVWWKAGWFWWAPVAMYWLAHAFQACWSAIAATLDLVWRLFTSIDMGIDGVVFFGSFLVLLFDGDLIMTAAFTYWRKSKRFPVLDRWEVFVLGLSSVVLLVAAGYVAYHALRMGLMFAAAFFLATAIKRPSRRRKKAGADGI